MFCNQCGHRNPGGSNFCSSCGAVLIREGDDMTLTLHTNDGAGEVHERDVEVSIDNPLVATLVVRRGAEHGTTFSLDAPVLVAGRSPQCDIFLDDVTVSRRHAEFHRDGDRYMIRDLRSLNGTYVNRARVLEAPLLPGDEVQIGSFHFVFLVAGARGADGR